MGAPSRIVMIASCQQTSTCMVDEFRDFFLFVPRLLLSYGKSGKKGLMILKTYPETLNRRTDNAMAKITN